MIYIGIDPGKGGGLAFISSDGFVGCIAMPESDRELYDYLRDYGGGHACYAVIEHVGPMPGQGVTSMFTFGQQFGRVKMACAALAIPFELVRPQKWQKELGLRSSKKEAYTDRKKRLKLAAERLWPGAKVTLKTADALLLAEYCRRTFG